MRFGRSQSNPSGLGGKSLPAVWGGASGTSSEPPLGEAQADDERRQTARLARVEAVLWLATEPLPHKKLARVASLKGAAEAKELVETLRRRLRNRRSAFDVIDVAGGLRLMTRPCFSPWLEAFGTAHRTAAEQPRLSHAAAETLTVVAYRQPVVRAEVEAIRGVGCGEVLRQLLEKDLLRIVGRSEELGRPLLYGTTGRFLELYGLGSLDDLPARDEGTGSAEPSKDNAGADDAA